MKSFIVNFGLFLALLFGCLHSTKALTDAEAEAMVTKVAEMCIKDVGLSAEEGKLVLANKFDDLDEKQVSEKLKCYLLCFYKKLGLFDEAGKPNAELFLKYAEERFKEHKDKIKPAMVKCMAIKDANPCEEMFKREMCMMESIEG